MSESATGDASHSDRGDAAWTLVDEPAFAFPSSTLRDAPIEDRPQIGPDPPFSIADDALDLERRTAVAAHAPPSGPTRHQDAEDARLVLVQAEPAVERAAAQPSTGRIEKVSGSASIMRNGVQIDAYAGAPIYGSDVIQTGSSGTLAIKFSDGTVFVLSAGTRVAVKEMAYTLASTSNSVLFNLIQGTMALFAGHAAKTGDFAIETPVATMGIRGTAILIEVAGDSRSAKFSLLRQPDGTEGSFVLLDKAHPGRVLAAITNAKTSAVVSELGGTDVLATYVAKSPEDLRSEGNVVRVLFQFVEHQTQRGGGSDIDHDFVIPPLDLFEGPDLHPQTILQPASFRAAAELVRIANPVPQQELTFGAFAVEDGPINSLYGLRGIAKAVIVQPPNLPAGVTFDERTSTFRLNPSDETFQHLAAGETAVVTVRYGVFNGIETIPAVATWRVQGRNDAPHAADDRFIGLSATGSVPLPVRLNDRDVDGDPLQIASLSQPIEGHVRIDKAGNLVFDPGDTFAPLSDGETATVSFTYTVTDAHGLTDTAQVAATIAGKGVFRPPTAEVAASTVLPDTGQSVTMSLSGPARTTKAAANLTLSVAFGDVHQPLNIVYVLDTSASANQRFGGETVGDMNNDGHPNTVLDAEIANLINLTNRVRSLGFSPSEVTVTIVPTGSGTALTFNLGSAGDEAIASALKALTAGGQANPERALQVAATTLQRLDPAGAESNHVFVLTDGKDSEDATAHFISADAGFNNKMGVVGAPGSAVLGGPGGSAVTYTYVSDLASEQYFALVNSEAANQRVRYYAILGDGRQTLVYDGRPENFTFDKVGSASAELGTTSFILRFEDDRDGDYDDFVTRVDVRPHSSSSFSLADEVTALRLSKAQISAVGVGANADLTALDTIDNTRGADIVRSADGLDISVIGLPFKSADIDRIDLSLNGREFYTAQDPAVQGGVFKLTLAASELNRFAGDANVVDAAVTLNTGETLLATLTIIGALPRTTDLYM